MTKRDIVVIGASAGGVTALKELAGSLPSDFKASIFIVLHVPPYAPSFMPEILTRAGRLKAVHPGDGDKFEPGRIYIAPPDCHLLLEDDRILVKRGPKENRFRPSIDALFRSAAYTFGSRVIGVVLTGLLNDGTSGMWSVKRLGGLTIVQEPEDAPYSSMPLSVMEYVDVDHVIPVAELAPLLVELTNEPAPETPELPSHELTQLKTEVAAAAEDDAFDKGILTMGPLTPLTCPECHGTLISIKEGKMVRYRCHTGHAFTASALLSEVTKNVEETLWSAVRGLEETVMLLEEAGKQFAEGGNQTAAEDYLGKAEATRERTHIIREFIFHHEQLSQDRGQAESV